MQNSASATIYNLYIYIYTVLHNVIQYTLFDANGLITKLERVGQININNCNNNDAYTVPAIIKAIINYGDEKTAMPWTTCDFEVIYTSARRL